MDAQPKVKRFNSLHLVGADFDSLKSGTDFSGVNGLSGVTEVRSDTQGKVVHAKYDGVLRG